MNAFKNSPTAMAFVLGLGLLFAPGHTTLAQTAGAYRPSATATSDSALVSGIASYRDDVRQSILLVSQQPQVLTSLAQQQANSQRAFNDLIHSYGQAKQGWFYDIARFPDVLHALATLPAGSDRSAVQAVTNTLPTDSQESAWKLYRHHHVDLVQVDNVDQQAGKAFDNLIAPLDVPTQTAFRQLIGMPDVLTLLTQAIDKTARLGQAYQADPANFTQNLTSLHDKLDAQNRQDLAEYQRELDQDPQAQQELKQAGKEYAQANGINPNPAWPNNPVYYQNPYSFWFGYPSWYGSPIWYPSAFGFGTGFYYGLGGNPIVYGLPSFGFSNWFFNYGYGYYPHLYNRFNAYYTYTAGPRRLITPGAAGFVGAARRAYSSNQVGTRGNWIAGNRTGGWNGSTAGARVAAPATRYSGGGNFGGTRSFGGGGFHGGGHR